MKVVIFCGGLGVRMGEQTNRMPKPMVQVGSRPILWHIMRYYAAWGHREFILCLGHKGDVIKEYFLKHDDALSNDFTLDRSNGERKIEILSRDTGEWRITFVDTGLHATIGERLKAVTPHIGSDEVFLATYGDGLTDAPLDELIADFHARGKMAMFLSVRPEFNAHIIETHGDGTVVSVTDMQDSEIRINGGYFVLRREVLDEIEPDDEFVVETFARLIPRREVVAHRYDGFFGPMDTIKDRQRLEALEESGKAPWRLVGLGRPRPSTPE